MREIKNKCGIKKIKIFLVGVIDSIFFYFIDEELLLGSVNRNLIYKVLFI